MRLKVLLISVVVLIGAALFMVYRQDGSVPVADTADGDVADYCQGLTELPDDLLLAVGNAAAGEATSDELSIIKDTAAHLRTIADTTTSADSTATLIEAADLLDKLASGEAMTDTEADSFSTTFENLEREVDAECSDG